MFEVVVIKKFKDRLNNNILRQVNETFKIETEERLRELSGEGISGETYIKLIRINKKSTNKEHPKIIIYQNYLYKIGGIETFIYNLTKYYKDRNIVLLVKNIEVPKMLELSEYCDIIIDDGISKYECDVLLLGNYNCFEALDRIKTNKVYQLIHADFNALIEKYNTWKNFNWIKDGRVDKIICVSETAKKGLKDAFGYKSEVIYNILDDDIGERPLTLITLSRATQEKGIHRILKMAKEFREHKKKFIWFLCCSLEQADPKIVAQLKAIPEFIIIPPSKNNINLINACDYLVQLSDTESFCYSAFEALQRGVPVILTDFIEARNIVIEGKNGYILDMDLKNLDINKIFNKIPNKVTFVDRCNKDDWEKVFKGEF